MADSSSPSLSLPPPPSDHNDALHLRLKTLDERVFDVAAASSMSVADFRAAVAQATAIPAPRQRLIYRGKLLKDGAALAAYDLQDGHTVHLVAKPPAAVEEDAGRRPADGPAWNLANLRSALRRTRASTTSGQELPVLREMLTETTREGGGAERSETQEPTVDLEPITQGILTMRTVLSTAQPEQQRQFFVGQWLDVKDTVNQWLEATIMDIADGKVLVHYHGWPTRWDEWIDFESDRIAAFRTRTIHSQNAQRMSPAPTTRVPSAPQVGGRDVRRTVAEVRNLMREMMPHIDQLADLCEEDLRRQQQGREERGVFVTVEDDTDLLTMPEDGQAREVSEVAHLVAPLFDRFGRLLMDTVQYLDPLLCPELRVTSQRQQERRFTALRRGHGGSSQGQTASVSTSMEVQDNSLSIRDLITTSPDLASELNQPRRSIDVHIHAIVAPASLSSLALLTRGNNDVGSNLDSGISSQTPSTPPIGRSFGFNDTSRNSDSQVSNDEGYHSRVPLLGSYRHRSHSQASDSSRHQQQRAVSRDLDDFLSNDFFGASFGHNNDDSDDESSVSYTHSDVMHLGPSAYRPPSLSERVSLPGTPSDEDDIAQYRSATIGENTEITAADEELQARVSETASQSNEDGRHSDNGRASHASAGSSSSHSSSGFPTFLEVMRRTLSGVRNFVHNEQSSSSSAEETSNSLELVSGFSVPSSSSSSSSSLLSTPPVSPVIQSSIENVANYRRGPSEIIIGETLDLDEVD